MKITVDTDICIGFGNCERTCPRLFKVSSGISSALVDEVPKDEEDCVRKAQEECPSGAISVQI
jgi:ferredoxin